ncbi:MAG: penicillin-binding protein [Bacteroidota bacterium]
MDVRRSILLRARIAFLAALLFAGAIVGKLVYLQLFQGTQWKQAAEATGLEYRPIKATRGNIYAADGSLLATSLPFYRVALDPCVVDEATFQTHIGALSERLAHFYQDKSAAAYQQLIQEARQAKRRYLVLNKKQISYQDKKQMMQWPIFCLGRFRGGRIFKKVEKRYRPFYELAARTIGYINAREYGPGLEYSFNKDLKGVNGKALYQKTLGGNWKMIYDGSADPPIHGYDLETTLDINLQDVAHNSLLKALQASEAAHGCVVVMEVNTGEIKAIANLSRTDDGVYKERYNYAVGNQGTIEPGSTFKLVSMLALLEETSIALTDTIDTGDGQYQFHDRVMKDVKKGGYGEITVQEAFEKSSNIGIARLVDEAFGKNPQKFIDYIDKLGLSKPLGLPIVGEGVPFVTTPKSPGWSGVTLPWMSTGYAVQVTPLHILTLYNAVANNGKMVQPLMVKKIKQANRTVKTFQGAVLNKNICTDDTLQKLKLILEGMVAHGLAHRFKHDFYPIAGKTGTAHKVANGRYTKDECISFVGYFPANAPRYSCMVVVDTPRRAGWHFGASVSTVVKDIADKIAAQDLAAQDFVTATNTTPPQGIFPLIKAGHRKELLQLCNTLGIAYQPETQSATWVRTAIKDDQIAWQDNGELSQGQVPHVRGMTLKNAFFLLENCGLHVTVQGNKAGRVKAQSLLPGTKGAQGKQIILSME